MGIYILYFGTVNTSTEADGPGVLVITRYIIRTANKNSKIIFIILIIIIIIVLLSFVWRLLLLSGFETKVEYTIILSLIIYYIPQRTVSLDSKFRGSRYMKRHVYINKLWFLILLSTCAV